MKKDRTWKDVVVDALQELGGEASLKDITTLARKDPKAKRNTTVREKVRQVVKAYKIFETVREGSGIYRLAPEAASLDLDRQATTKSVTDEIQGALLYIGRVNNYETFAPADDRTKRQFGGHSLEHFVSVRDLAARTRLKKDEVKKIERIDVLWLSEDGEELLPRFAFEVENSTKVLAGLNRLSVIPRLYQTRLFIIGEGDKQRRWFDDHLNGPTFKTYSGLFGFKYFDEVRGLFKVSEAFKTARAANEAAMKSAGLHA